MSSLTLTDQVSVVWYVCTCLIIILECEEDVISLGGVVLPAGQIHKAWHMTGVLESQFMTAFFIRCEVYVTTCVCAGVCVCVLRMRM